MLFQSVYKTLIDTLRVMPSVMSKYRMTTSTYGALKSKQHHLSLGVISEKEDFFIFIYYIYIIFLPTVRRAHNDISRTGHLGLIDAKFGIGGTGGYRGPPVCSL